MTPKQVLDLFAEAADELDLINDLAIEAAMSEEVAPQMVSRSWALLQVGAAFGAMAKDIRDLLARVDETEPEEGGDSPECYEYVLHQARTMLSWKADRLYEQATAAEEEGDEREAQVLGAKAAIYEECGIAVEALIDEGVEEPAEGDADQGTATEP